MGRGTAKGISTLSFSVASMGTFILILTVLIGAFLSFKNKRSQGIEFIDKRQKNEALLQKVENDTSENQGTVQVRDIHEGKWSCQSVKDPSQHSEYCLDLGSQTGQRHKGQQITSQATCIPLTTEKAASDKPAQGEAGGWSGSLVPVVVIVPLIAITVLLTPGVWLCRRKKALRVSELVRKSTASRFWIGLHRTVVYDNWYWVAGKDKRAPLNYTNWAPGEPNNPYYEHCGEMVLGEDGGAEWNDLCCYEQLPFICFKGTAQLSCDYEDPLYVRALIHRVHVTK
ncbi:UNVERIFIED_CONTAM: hypothetical protein FKN15_030379 [Acipenser sinensis]